MPDHTDLTTRDMAGKALALIEQHLIDCASQAEKNGVWLRWILGLSIGSLFSMFSLIIAALALYFGHR